MSNGIVNKVAQSGIVSIDLENFLPTEAIISFDMKDYLFMGLILREKEFRENLKQTDLSKYGNKIVALTCSADAVIPMWAYMLVASALQPVASQIIFGTVAEAEKQVLLHNLSKLDVSAYTDQRVVVKGCGERPVPEVAFVQITQLLRPIAKSIMYGEPCSTVPVFKKPHTTLSKEES